MTPILALILIFIIGVFGAAFFWMYRLNVYWKLRGIPARFELPFIGSYYPFIFRKLAFPEFQYHLYTASNESKYVGMMDLHTPSILLKDPELIKLICIKHFDNFPDHKLVGVEDADTFFGKMLYFVTGKRWKDMHALIRPAFTSSKMKFMFDLISEAANDFVSYLVRHPEETSSIEMKDALTRFTADAIAVAAFGFRVQCMENKNNDFHSWGRRATEIGNVKFMGKLLFNRAFPGLARWLGVSLISEKSAKLFKDLIKENLASRTTLNIERPDVMNTLMQTRGKINGVDISVDDVIGQAFNTFFAGFDTSSTLMCYAVYELAVNQDIQKRLQGEVDQALARGNGVISYEIMNDMKYLDAVVAETLRKYPPLPWTDRICRKAFELDPPIDGAKKFTLEPGMFVFIPIYSLHHDPKHFPQPDKFDPERFSKDNKAKITPGTYVPFGIGPRVCLGDRLGLMQVKLILAHLLAKFDINITTKTRVPLRYCKRSLTMGIDGGLWLELKNRESTKRNDTYLEL